MIQTQGPGCPCMFCRSTLPRKSVLLSSHRRIVGKPFPIGAISSPKTVRSFCPFFNGSYRIVDQRWINSSNTDVDRFQYGYDRNSNCTYKENTINMGLSEVYTNDDLNQLASYKLGTLNGGKTDVTGTATNAQTWDYDATGNWDSITTNGTTQTRGANKQNEISSVSGATTPTYDNNGTLTKDENNYRFVYDAWNQQVMFKNASDAVITTNSFNGINQNIKVVAGSSTIDRIFSTGWQPVEAKSGSNTVSRNVWSPVYVDALVLRDRDTDANGSLDERLFPLQDTNFNVTAITNTSGTVQERYTYTPFGVVTYRDASGSTIGSSTKAWVFLHQGGQINIVGDYDFRNRVLSPTLGRWLTNDPLGFDAGDVNTYRYVKNCPHDLTDSYGLFPPSYKYQERKYIERKLKFNVAKQNGDNIIGSWKVYPRESYVGDPNIAANRSKEEEFEDINGYIIQRLTRHYSGMKFLNGKTNNTVSAKQELYKDLNVTYFEVWEVRNGEVTFNIGGMGKIKTADGYDTWKRISNTKPTDGALTISAEARFYSTMETGPNPDFLAWGRLTNPVKYIDEENNIAENFVVSSGSAKASQNPPDVWKNKPEATGLSRVWGTSWEKGGKAKLEKYVQKEIL